MSVDANLITGISSSGLLNQDISILSSYMILLQKKRKSMNIDPGSYGLKVGIKIPFFFNLSTLKHRATNKLYSIRYSGRLFQIDEEIVEA